MKNAEIVTTTGLPVSPTLDIRSEFEGPVFDGIKGQCIDAPEYLPTGLVFKSSLGDYSLISIIPRERAFE